MTTETLSRPPPVTGVAHRGPESSEADLFRDVVEDRNEAGNVHATTMPGGSFLPPSDAALSTLAKEKGPEESPAPEQNEDQVEKGPLPPVMPSEGIKMADESNPSEQGHDVNGMQEPSLEQPKAEEASSLLAQEEGGSQPECHGKTPDALSERQHPVAVSVSEEEEESRQQPHSPERDITAPTDSPKEPDVGPEEKASPPAHQGKASDLPSEPQNSTTSSAQLDLEEESSTTGSHSQLSSVDSGSVEVTEVASSPEEADSSEDNGQATYAALVSPQSPSSLLPGPNSPKKEGDCCISPRHHSSASPSPAESEGTSSFGSIQEEIKEGCSEMPRDGEEERRPSEPVPPSLAPEGSSGNLKEHSLREDSGDHLQATEEEQVAQDTTCQSVAPSSPGLADPQADMGPSGQQRAAVTGCEAVPLPVLTPSPVATAGIFGPAHRGLAAECDDGHAWERQAVHKPSGGGGEDDTKPQVEAGGKAAAPGSERGEEAATRSPEPEGNKEPEGAKEPPRAKDLVRELPGLESPVGASDPSGPSEPSGAMVLASAEEPHEARYRAGSQDLASTAYPVPAAEHSVSNQVPSREGLLLDIGDPAELACSTPIADEPSAMDVSGCPTDWTEGAADSPEIPHSVPETPIEREIRLHQEREELLRRERGLANPRGTQEYVEVRIRPILNQSAGSSTLPKEKERQWAGVQMQREIQRECQREEDLVQLGKVRGAYDRGTPKELQEKKMIFEQHFSSESLASKKRVCSNSTEGSRGPSFTEADCATNMVILDSRALLHSQRPQPEKASSANPFFCLRAKSPQSLLEQEVQEAQERERELQRQRYSLYGSALPCPSAETTEQEEDVPTQPERPSCKKLDVTWPPPSSSETSQVNGLHQPERSPRVLRRQRSALIERWESGAVGKQENED
uniref:Uncharacterized protein MISP3 isoform X1 n=1 Tax=Pogona vitticeps TaxID=103695 RepID=A0A6J0U823_9SAUR